MGSRLGADASLRKRARPVSATSGRVIIDILVLFLILPQSHAMFEATK
jgi:hypothetical protein